MQDPGINLLHTHFNLVRAAESALRVSPGEHAVRYLLSARLLLKDDYEPTIQHPLSQKYQAELTTQKP